MNECQGQWPVALTGITEHTYSCIDNVTNSEMKTL